MDFLSAAPAPRPAYNVCQFSGCPNRAIGHDRACYRAAVPFLSVLVQDIGDLLPTPVVYQLGCTVACGRIEAHIQRAVVPKSKPPGRRIQLKTAEAQIKQNAVNSGKAPLAGDSIYLIKRRLGHAQSAGADFAGKTLPNSSDGRGVNVQPQNLPVADPILGHLVTGKRPVAV
jgi:hypothetical protein